MSWQMLIWNIFIWTFTGVMIYANQASMWWLLLPTLFTGAQNANDLYKISKEQESSEQFELDEATRQKMLGVIERAKRNGF